MDIKKKFGVKIRSLRLKTGLSQESFGNKAKLHRTYIGNIERGEKNITLENIQKLAIALEVEIKDLFEE
ncbi:helix-turn-helix transcriptional regulator [Candidatus Gracilibacteria bacterium]|nr:helix-turn-helix transcriptional regulator [Candidatus Gracilibacteria bacterium]